jgi:hypothetical protein
MPKRIAPSEVKAQELAALLQGHSALQGIYIYRRSGSRNHSRRSGTSSSCHYRNSRGIGRNTNGSSSGPRAPFIPRGQVLARAAT